MNYLKDINTFRNLETRLFRGRRSRNKVSVGESAEGSLTIISCFIIVIYFLYKLFFSYF